MRHLLLFLTMLPHFLFSQELEGRIIELEKQIDNVRSRIEKLGAQRDELRLELLLRDLQETGLPASNTQIVTHPGHVLSWNEEHEQPNWVAHIIDVDIRRGNAARVDTFLPDPQVTTGTSTTADYSFSGYDRGHMVPSADMRWNYEAMKATYFYSNIAPQHPDLNRSMWAEMEDWVRRYVNFSGNRVFVVTGPLLRNGLPTIQPKGHQNAVSIPEQYYKVVVDLDSKEVKGIAFLMPNGLCDQAISHYATTIDEIEQLTGIDFYPQLNEEQEAMVESIYNTTDWVVAGDPHYGRSEPLKPPLPKGVFNTIQAKYHVGHEITVCGKVVSTKKNTKGTALYLNFDKLYPDQDFYATIWEYNSPNFSYDPETFLLNKTICVTGKVISYQQVARISVNRENEITLFDNLLE